MSDENKQNKTISPVPVQQAVHSPAWWLASVGGVGRSPVAPGTCGSLVALPLAWLIVWLAGDKWLLGAVFVVFFVGWACSTLVSKQMAEHDPQEIVIDEVVGQWIALLFVPLNWHWFIVSFVLFRAFDIIKPWPINEAERRFQGGFGIMIDDVLAGLFALASTQAIYLILSLFH
jgi:phosphatidylglycerophosphatase A